MRSSGRIGRDPRPCSSGWACSTRWPTIPTTSSTSPTSSRFQRSMLAEMVGGEQQLDRLTAEPLPDEPFDDQGIPDQIAVRVAETLALRRPLLRGAARHRAPDRRPPAAARRRDRGPARLRGRSKPRTAAAGLCWMVGRANESVGYGDLQTQELMAWFGLKAPPVTRAYSIQRALGSIRSARRRPWGRHATSPASGGPTSSTNGTRPEQVGVHHPAAGYPDPRPGSAISPTTSASGPATRASSGSPSWAPQ